MSRDRESNIWIGTGKGLLRLNANGVASRVEADHGATGAVNTIFEDREGNLWVGSTRGIERFRNSAFMTFSAPAALSEEASGPVYADADGRIWFAPSGGGLYWQQDGQIGHVNNAALDQDVIYSITGSKGELWIGRQRGGLSQLKYNDRTFITQTYTQAEGLAQNSVYAVHQSRDRTVWAGSLSGGLSRFKDGKFTTYTVASGLASNSIT